MKYYLHDSSAFDDEKVSDLFINFGYEGVGLFYVILEKIAKQEKPVKTSVLKKQLRIGKKLEKCWKFMEEIDLISSSNGETFNKQLLNFSENYKIKNKKTAERVSQWRERQADAKNVTHNKRISNAPKVNRSKDKDIVNTISTWRNDFLIYKKDCHAAFSQYRKDKEFISKLEHFHPNVNVIKSIDKSYEEYWSKEEAWEYKKKQKIININWEKTITNALNQSFNKVYYTKQELAAL